MRARVSPGSASTAASLCAPVANASSSTRSHPRRSGSDSWVFVL
jgi:hypothetical protein